MTNDEKILNFVSRLLISGIFSEMAYNQNNHAGEK
jgi:hypothetical protein